ncbi:hypothetical protein [Streptomyces sp. NPDC054794]
MSSAVNTGRHAARSGVRGTLLVALLAFLITTFTPAFADVPPSATGDSAVLHHPQALTPTSDEHDTCETLQVSSSSDGGLDVVRDAPHHGGGHRASIVSRCRHRSRLVVLGWHRVVCDALARVTALGAQGRAPASAHRRAADQLSRYDVLRC